MKNLTEKQVKRVYDWLNSYEQLRGTAIPLRFKEEFTKIKNKITPLDKDHMRVIFEQSRMTNANFDSWYDFNYKRKKLLFDL